MPETTTNTCGDIWENTDGTEHVCILPREPFGAHAMHQSATHMWAEVYESEQDTYDAVPIPETETPIFDAVARRHRNVVMLAEWECALLYAPSPYPEEWKCEEHAGHFGPLPRLRFSL